MPAQGGDRPAAAPQADESWSASSPGGDRAWSGAAPPGDPQWTVPSGEPSDADRANGVEFGAWGPAALPRPRRRPLRAAVVALVTLVGAAVIGLPYGWLWALLAPDPELVKITAGFYPEDGLYPLDPQPEEFIASDGWFFLLGLGFGVLAALAVWFVARRWRGPLLLGALTVGAVAGGVVAWWLGHRIGLSGYEDAVARAAQGAHVRQPSQVQIQGLGTWRGLVPRVQGVLLAEAFGAAVAYTLLAGWSRYSSLRPVAPSAADAAPWPPGWPVSSAPAEPRAGTAAPAPPGPDEAAPPRA